MRTPFKQVNVKFLGKLSENFQDCTLYGVHVHDIMSGLGATYEDFEKSIYQLILNNFEFNVTLNGQVLTTPEDYRVLFTKRVNELTISPVVVMEGSSLGNILLGVGFGLLAITGVGFLGISATTFGLLGASLIFSSIFKTPKSDVTKEPDKRSINFSGTINVVGGSQPVPLCFGVGVYCGSIVVSADLASVSRPV
jgi:predicted phage tail protein